MVQVKKIKVNFNRDGVTMDTNREEFAIALKTWRYRQGMTQRQVAEKFGCSRYTIMNAENAKNISWIQAYKLFAHLAKELQAE